MLKRAGVLKRTATALVLVPLLATTACGALEAAESDTVKVGVLVAKSGPAAPYGNEEAAAIEAVAEKTNAAGGIGGKQIELVVEDTKTDPTEAVRLAGKMILDENVIAIIGATTGSETLAFLGTSVREKVPAFPMAGTTSVTDPDEDYFDWVYRMSIPLDEDLPASRERIVADGHKRVALFFEEDAYGEEGSKMFEDLSGDKGDLAVVAKVSAPKDATDLSSVATQIASSDADAVYMNTASPNSAAALLRAIRGSGVNVPVYGLAGIVQHATLEAAGPAANGLIAPALVNPDAPGKLTDLFSLMRGRGGVEGFGALLGANAMAAVIEAVKAGATDGESLQKKIKALGPIEGYAAAPIEYSDDDHDGWGRDTLFYVKVADGRFTDADQ